MPGDGTGREGGGPRKGAVTGKGGGREGEAERTELFLFREHRRWAHFSKVVIHILKLRKGEMGGHRKREKETETDRDRDTDRLTQTEYSDRD